jgi:G patch domain/KOW motif-containing protein
LLQSDVADYDSVPIDAFGAAMLRGMGWTEGAPIGNTRKGYDNNFLYNVNFHCSVVIPKIPELRPKGLGLGADRSLVAQMKGIQQGKPGTSAQTELQMRVGAFVRLIGGKNVDAYGTVSARFWNFL